MSSTVTRPDPGGAAEVARASVEFSSFINKRYDNMTERMDDHQIRITHIEDGTTVLPDPRGPASDELKTAFKDAIIEAVTKLHATGILGLTPTSTGLTIPGQPPPTTTARRVVEVLADGWCPRTTLPPI